MTDVLRFDNNETYIQYLTQARDVLRTGGLVGIPTETVYGILANAENRQAMEKLIAIKERPKDKPFTFLIGHKKDVGVFVENIPLKADRIIRRLWPGPLTILFTKEDGSVIGLRMPENKITLDLLDMVDFTVVAPSANPAEAAPAVTAQQVMDYFDNTIDLVLDGGEAPLKTASTIILFDGDNYRIVRKGPISTTDLKRAANTMILFVCTGNTCRSAMAEGLCKMLLARKAGVSVKDLEDNGYTVVSAGVGTGGGVPATEYAVEAAKDYHVDISAHCSQPLTPALVERADVVYAMTQEHLRIARSMLREKSDKCTLLSPYGEDITDPLGGTLATYKQCAQILFTCITERLNEK